MRRSESEQRAMDAILDDNEWLTNAEFAAIVGVSPSTVRTWRSEGRDLPPSYRPAGGLVRWRRSEVMAWLEASRE